MTFFLLGTETPHIDMSEKHFPCTFVWFIEGSDTKTLDLGSLRFWSPMKIASFWEAA